MCQLPLPQVGKTDGRRYIQCMCVCKTSLNFLNSNFPAAIWLFHFPMPLRLRFFFYFCFYYWLHYTLRFSSCLTMSCSSTYSSSSSRSSDRFGLCVATARGCSHESNCAPFSQCGAGKKQKSTEKFSLFLLTSKQHANTGAERMAMNGAPRGKRSISNKFLSLWRSALFSKNHEHSAPKIDWIFNIYNCSDATPLLRALSTSFIWMQL